MSTEISALTSLMRAQETLTHVSDVLGEISSDLNPEESFATGMMCADLLALVEELFDEFAILFPDEYRQLGEPPEFQRPEGLAEEIVGALSDHFQHCQQYVAQIGALLPVSVEQTEITDEQLWELS